MIMDFSHTASSLLVLLALVFIFSSVAQSDYEDQRMIPEESEAVYDVLEAINSEIPWRSLHPGNLCLYGPHGLVCEIDDNKVWHVVELNLGWVADDDNNPQCGRNASISASIQKFQYLRKLFFYNCFTSSKAVIPSAVWSLRAPLQHLVFMRNPALVGAIPRQFAMLSRLERLVMMDNALEGSIPKELGKLQQLAQLALSHNQLSGEIPDSLGSLAKMKVLDLSGNQLEGSIPQSIGGLRELQKLDLSSNKLSGSVPIEVGELRELQMLDMSRNNLSGSLPTSLSCLGKLRVIQLSNNFFDCELPNLWSNLSYLVGVGLSNAGLKGRIPETMGDLKVRYLELANNSLEGTIPIRLGQLPSIYRLDLSGNRLVGLLPFSEDFVAKLGRNLVLSNNQGLCYTPESGDVVGLQACNDAYSATFKLQGRSSSTGISWNCGHVSWAMRFTLWCACTIMAIV